MKLLKYLGTFSIRYKILGSAAVGIIGFSAYLFVNMNIASDNKQRLHDIEKVLFPVLQYSDASLVQLTRLQETFQLAVSSAEEDMLEDATVIKDGISENLHNIRGLQKEFDEYLMTLTDLLESYFSVSMEISQAMINGNADADIMSKRVPEMQSNLEATKSAFTGFRESMHIQFVNTLQTADSSAARAIYLGLGLAVVVIILLLVASQLVAQSITSSIVKVNESLIQMASGNADLTQRLAIRSKDEIGELCLAFNAFMARMLEMMGAIKTSGSELSQTASQMGLMSGKVDEAVASQQNATTQVATAITQMSASIAEVSENATAAENITREANTATQTGLTVVKTTVEAMLHLSTEVNSISGVIQKLAMESEKIGGVLDVIQGISEQTNLLALNAAIEAARAGEQGRGFAVVADEVRTLANRTRDATHEIQAMIEELQKGAENAVSAMEKGVEHTQSTAEQARETDSVLNKISELIDKIHVMNTQIASATEQQSAVAHEIDEKTVDIRAHADKTREETTNTKSISDSLTMLSQQLNAMTSQYKT
ncbi:MAG: methyl-accepting chemotaxis protein [Gammaproteobacteria bacterium]|nr:methyl-accepting chemotaxis protein [Gammaproteobacteria bacterium]MDH5732015.1 methyl-accepting chemotaxis protein [Gammaproteobacteria bacterium]